MPRSSTTRRARLAKRSLGSFILDVDVSIEERREGMERVDRLPRPRRVDYQDVALPGPAGPIPAIVATPTDEPFDREILYLHGGGYALGSPRTHVAMCARLAKRAAAKVTVIDYRLAPEHEYPAAIDDCVAACRAMVTGGTDPGRLTIAGDSAGGGATLATLCRLRDDGDRLPACAYLLSPWTDLSASGDTVRSKADIDPMIRADMITDLARLYAGDRPLDHPGLSPLFADLGGLPPMLIQTGEDEVLLSDSTRLAERAGAADVDVRLDIAPEMWHVYQAFAGWVPEATDALVRGAVFIRTHTPARDLTTV